MGITITIVFIGLCFLKNVQVAHAQLPIGLLSPPYFGTTTVNTIFDHQYPDYDAIIVPQW
jgi:hypothetical protein